MTTNGRILWLLCAGQASAGDQPKWLYQSRDAGVHWSLIARSGSAAGDLPVAGEIGAGSLASNAPGSLWLALNRNALFHSTDGGRTWRVSIAYDQTGPSGAGIGPVAFVDQRHGWAVALPNRIWITADAGKRWAERTVQ